MRRADNTISVEISRFGESPKEYTVSEDSSLRDVLDEAGIRDLSPSEVVWVNGQRAASQDILEDGDVIQIVGKKEGGLK